MAPDAHIGDHTRSITFRRVLVGYDGSAEAQRALRTAVALAGDLGGEAHVLLVVRPPVHAETNEAADLAAAAEAENLARGLQEHLGPRDADVTTEFVVSDDPGRALAEHAEEHGFDLVVVGGHGREQPTHRGIGQSLEILLRHHPCPVVVV